MIQIVVLVCCDLKYKTNSDLFKTIVCFLSVDGIRTKSSNKTYNAVELITDSVDSVPLASGISALFGMFCRLTCIACFVMTRTRFSAGNSYLCYE